MKASSHTRSGRFKQGGPAFQLRGAVGTLLLSLAAAFALFSRPPLRSNGTAEFLVEIAGWCTFLLGVGFRLWATLYIGGRKFSNVVDQGPYSVCRNPLYLGTFLMALSAGFFLESIFFIAMMLFGILLYRTSVVPSEEQALHQRHGKAYDDYCERVPRFLPNFALYRSPESFEVRARGLALEAKRLLLWIWLPFIAQELTRWRACRWWPHWFQFW